MFSCVGCHESKDESPPSGGMSMALSNGIEQLQPFFGEPRGFSFGADCRAITFYSASSAG
jgi:hypothetical protein